MSDTITPPPAPAPKKVNRIGLEIAPYRGSKTTLCAGCGHNAITERIIDSFYEMGVDPKRVMKFSGIGCSSKSPAYFLNPSHGFNSVHGRMPAVAAGAHAANRSLVCVGISGDGDSLSIGLGQLCHAIRHAGASLLHRLRCADHVRREQRLRSTPGERRLSGKHLVRNQAERVDVGAMVDARIGTDLFGRHVCRRADCDAGAGDAPRGRGIRHRLRYTEISNERDAAGQQHVLGLYVAMHDAVVVRIRQRARDLSRQPHRLGDRQLAARQPLAQRLAFDERHRVVRQPVRLTSRQQRDDVRMLKAGGQRDLTLEPRERHVRGQFGGQYLHDEPPMKADVVGHEDA